MFIVVLDIFGKVVKHYDKHSETFFTVEEATSKFHDIAFATSMLTFENIKFMLLEKNDLKIVVINLNEDSLIIGIDKNATWSDISGTFSYIECLISRIPSSILPK